MIGRSVLLVSLAAAVLTAASIGVVERARGSGSATSSLMAGQHRRRGEALLELLAEELDVSLKDLEAAVHAVVEHELDVAAREGRLSPEHLASISRRLDTRHGLGLVVFGGLRTPIGL